MTVVTDVNKHPFVVLHRSGCLRFVGVGQLAPGDRQVFLLAVSTGSLAVRRIWARCVLRPVDLETCVTPRSSRVWSPQRMSCSLARVAAV